MGWGKCLVGWGCVGFRLYSPKSKMKYVDNGDEEDGYDDTYDDEYEDGYEDEYDGDDNNGNEDEYEDRCEDDIRRWR